LGELDSLDSYRKCTVLKHTKKRSNYSGARFLAACGGSLIHFAVDFAAAGGKVHCKNYCELPQAVSSPE